MGWGELPPTSELGRSLLLASASWRGSERSKEDAARLLEPAGIWWGLFFLGTVCRCEGMNKRVRKIYCSHSLAVALYLYSGSGGGEAGAGGDAAGARRKSDPCQSFCKGCGVQVKVRLGGVYLGQLCNYGGPECPLPPPPAYPLQEPIAGSLGP